MESMPDIGAAHALYTGSPMMTRWVLEARVLAGEPAGEIAARLSVTSEVIELYELLFYDVREHLDQTDYILLTVIRLEGGPMLPDRGTVWKWFAYRGGPRVLDFMLGTNSGFIKPESRERFDDFAIGHVRDELLKQVAVGALTLTVDGRSAGKLIDIYLRGLKDERRGRESAPTLVAIGTNVMTMRENLPETVKARVEPLM